MTKRTNSAAELRRRLAAGKPKGKPKAKPKAKGD